MTMPNLFLCARTLGMSYVTKLSIGSFLLMEQTTILFCALPRPKKKLKTYNKVFVRFHNHSLLLAMVKAQGAHNLAE